VSSVYPADLAIIVALPFIHKGAGFLEEPFFAWAPVTALEWLVAGRWCQLVSCFVAKTDEILLCGNLPDSHDVNPLSD
jgi:hypothetical protein